MDVPQDFAAALIVPVVDDVLHHVGVRTCRDGLEEVARREFDTVSDTFFFEQLTRALDHEGQVKQNPLRLRIGFQYSREQQSMTAGDVNQFIFYIAAREWHPTKSQRR